MSARDITTGEATSPVPYKLNPNYKSGDGSPKYLPAEPHIGLSGVNDEAAAPTYQTGIVAGGTTNPPEGDDGSVKRISLEPGDVDIFAKKTDQDFAAFDKETEDNPTVNQKVLNEEIGSVDKDAEIAKSRATQEKAAAKAADADAPVTTTTTK